MTTLFDLFGLLSVVVRGLDLAAQSVLLGTLAFEALVLRPAFARGGAMPSSMRRALRRMTLAAACATIAATTTDALLNAIVLKATLALPLSAVAGASFVVVAGVRVVAAAGLAALQWTAKPSTGVAAGVLALAVLCAGVAESHAAARMSGATPLLVATALHEGGAALWLGGLPAFHRALAHGVPQTALAGVGARFSRVAALGVAMIVAGAVVFALAYVGSGAAILGTTYGTMAVAKALLLCVLLGLGAANFLAVRRFGVDPAAPARVARFVVAEMGIGAAAIMAAASIGSMPPAVDLDAPVPARVIALRLTPSAPRLDSPTRSALALPALQAQLDRQWRDAANAARPQAFVPGAGVAPPRNAADVAWSEFNHHWAGIVVIAVGVMALLQQTGRAGFARHWPLLFVALAVLLFLRADPEAWPLGEIGFVDSLRDPEVVQHRVFVLLIAGFGLFEWGVRTGRLRSRAALRAFPLMTAIGGTLLLTHSHALGSVTEEVLAELSHVPIAVLGIVAGWSRWLEIESPPGERAWAGWTWPVAFILIGLVLLDYREA